MGGVEFPFAPVSELRGTARNMYGAPESPTSGRLPPPTHKPPIEIVCEDDPTTWSRNPLHGFNAPGTVLNALIGKLTTTTSPASKRGARAAPCTVYVRMLV